MNYPFHVCSPRTSNGSRVFAQLESASEGAVVTVKPHTIADASLLSRVMHSRQNTYIFHEPNTLPLLLVCLLLSLICRRKHKFVYDMHDLRELGVSENIRGKCGAAMYIALEWLIAKLGIPFLTVSKGLAANAARRYGQLPVLFYNSPQKLVPDRAMRPAAPSVVYFGIIHEKRLPHALLANCLASKIQVDIYGKLNKATDAEWFDRVINIISATGGSYKGSYSPQDLTFLKNYSYSLLYFPDERLNFRYAMPNKLFQSLHYGLRCLVSPNMQEAIEEFGPLGAVMELDESSDVAALLQNPPHLDESGLVRRLAAMRAESRANFVRAAGLSSESAA
jgi:hypothetical protein